MAEPKESFALPRTDGEWILTQFGTDQIEIKLHGDSLGRKATYWIHGDLELPRTLRYIPGEER